MPHSFSNSERIRRQIKELVDQKREQEQAKQPSGKSETKPRKTSKQKKRTR